MVVDGIDPLVPVVADVGSGTGIFARQLASELARRNPNAPSIPGANTPEVIAVEPNAAMRDAAEAHPLVQHRDGTAESTGLPGASVSAVTCAQAFHWFRPKEALAEFARVLAPGGRLWLIWNDLDERDGLTSTYRRAILKASDDHPAARGFARNGHHVFLQESSLFTAYAQHEFANQQSFDVAGLLGRARSASYCPQSGPKWDELEMTLRDAFARFAEPDGRVTLRLLTRAYCAARA
jgi:ubiquinone/menaquinone biosynthesis C-methylase UbiE